MLGASFQIGRSALASYQAALSVTGQNIANAANPDYTRQTARLAAQVGGPVLGGVAPGGGVMIAQLNRHVDEALESRLRVALGARDGADVLYRALSQTETLYNELSDEDVSSQLSAFFASFTQLQTNPQDSSTRNLVITAADNLIRSFNRQRTGLIQQVDDLNNDAIAAADAVNGMADEIAKLNQLIVEQEADGATVASALRDRRGSLVREIGSMMDVEVRELGNGTLNVFAGSEPLVQFNRSRGIRVETVLEDGLAIATVRFADNNSEITIRSGKMNGMLSARDRFVRNQLDRLDQLAKGLIFEVNRLHTSGVGMVGHNAILSEYAVLDPDAALNAADSGLSFPVVNGTMIVHVRDETTGSMITRQIEVDLDGLNGDDTTLKDLAAALDAVPGLSASVSTDLRLKIDAGADRQFWFSDDRSGALAAIGVGGFFTGVDARTIDITADVRSDNRKIAASLSGALNDADNAGRIATLAARSSSSALLDGRNIQDFHLDMIGDLAAEASAALTDQQAGDAVYASLFAQREAVSGVSLDEEAINLSRFEAAYQGAARYLTVVDNLTDELLALL